VFDIHLDSGWGPPRPRRRHRSPDGPRRPPECDSRSSHCSSIVATIHRPRNQHTLTQSLRATVFLTTRFLCLACFRPPPFLPNTLVANSAEYFPEVHIALLGDMMPDLTEPDFPLACAGDSCFVSGVYLALLQQSRVEPRICEDYPRRGPSIDSIWPHECSGPGSENPNARFSPYGPKKAISSHVQTSCNLAKRAKRSEGSPASRTSHFLPEQLFRRN